MELYIDASVIYSGSKYELNIGPSSKCALMLCKYPNKLENVKVCIVVNDTEYPLLNSDDINNYEKKLQQLDYCAKIIKFSHLADDYKVVDFPLTTYNSKILIYSGAAAVFRSLIQSNYEPGEKIPILGRSQSCLKACKERSKWTLMCEKSIIDAIVFFDNESPYFSDELFRDLSDGFIIDKGSPSSVKLDFNSKKCFHKFLEGPQKTLTDIVIAFYLLEYCKRSSKFLEVIKTHQLLFKWLCEMKNEMFEDIIDHLEFLPISWIDQKSRLKINIDYNFSISEGIQKLKIKNKNMPELKDLVAMDSISCLKIDIETMKSDIISSFNWSRIPFPLRPSHSPIPETRQLKKSHQLLNMIECANRLIQPGMTIVDFCSGGGHLGIMLASLHPDCRVILLENKEESLLMAENRIKESGLANIKLFKCNILAYNGHFDIGLALHACGCVTDLVIEICLSRNAHAVISPCCYGSIIPTANINYPRSLKFASNVNVDVYSKLSHGADCFNSKPEKIEVANHAMNLVDSDRCHYVAEHGYMTKIFKMEPQDCTPKNHILFLTKI